ncbi:hypothetical protein GW17_00032040 [Ensete ventricosum]|nr:hypothetical protein GW17_00032040 [Ensete ventricosum]RZR97105.1 hypothetical protein BHM03_00026259 [Ensete ventricosum]
MAGEFPRFQVADFVGRCYLCGKRLHGKDINICARRFKWIKKTICCGIVVAEGRPILQRGVPAPAVIVSDEYREISSSPCSGGGATRGF